MEITNSLLNSLKLSDETLKSEIYNITNMTCPCIICSFELDNISQKNYNEIFKHLAEVHHIIVSNTDKIFDVPCYLSYWKKRLNEDLTLRDICSVIQTNCKLTDPSPSEFFYVLCDLLPEDKKLREDLSNKELQRVLNHQKLEWADLVTVNLCLFCNYEFKGKKYDLFKHMEEMHNFYIDCFENLVFVDELLQKLRNNLRNLICLYCEKTFKSHLILKEHIRKKRHKRLRKSNTKYFKYLITKYLINSDENIDESDDDQNNLSCEFSDVDLYMDDDSKITRDTTIMQEKEWTEWADEESTSYVCLFCSFSCNDIISHMINSHSFNLADYVCNESLTDYHTIKMINYIRRQMFQNICFFCHDSFDSKIGLYDHFTETKHSSSEPKLVDYNQPQYFFPTYEDDNLLCLVTSLRKRYDSKDGDVNVIAETSIFD